MFRQRKLEDAREHAELGVQIAEKEARWRATAQELLAQIALARHDADGARAAAELAQQADPKRPLATYVDARLLYDQGNFDEAAPLFDKAIGERKKAGGEPFE